MIRNVVLAALLLGAGGVSASDESSVERCAALTDERERLDCYDERAAGNEQSAPPPVPEPSPLSVRWELEAATKQGTFTFRPHRQNYFLPFRYSTDPNDQPVSPRTGPAPMLNYDTVESKFQLSFKVKAVEGLFKDRADLWFAYTQQSSWQVYNDPLSRPFRETNFEPEMMLVFPTRFRLLGLEARLINVGLVHQSNGQSEPLSRSWNRIYLQLGFERGRFALLVRPWYRFSEPVDEDDNRDIDDFLGYGDIQAIFKSEAHTLSLLLRNNLSSPNRGSVQIDWTLPRPRRLRGYVQFFTGYGESMVDYNHRQTTIGVGLILTNVL